MATPADVNMKCPYCDSKRVVKASWPTTNRKECLDCAGIFMPDGSIPIVEYEPRPPMTAEEFESAVNELWGKKIKEELMEEVKHYQVNGKYRVVFERSAVKGVDGFKVEANGDDMEAVRKDANDLYDYAQNITTPKTYHVEA